jgi:hypothetical protein
MSYPAAPMPTGMPTFQPPAPWSPAAVMTFRRDYFQATELVAKIASRLPRRT